MHDEPAEHSTPPNGTVMLPEAPDLTVIKRGRGRPRKSAAPTTPKAPAGPPGRPMGFRVATFNTLNELTLEDFSFVRGVFNGLSAQDSFLRFYANIHFDQRGNPVIPHGLTINARFDYLEGRIQQAANLSEDKSLQRAAKVLNTPLPSAMADKDERDNLEALYQRWYENLPEDQFTEKELPEAFQAYLVDNDIKVSVEQTQEVSRSTLIDSKVKALNELQTVLAYLPRPDAKTSIWLAASVHKALADANILDLRQLVRFISFAGRNWYRQIGRIGPVRAKRIEAWLGDHAATLGHINRSGAAWRPYKPLKTALVPLERAPEIAKLEYAEGSKVAAVAGEQLIQREGIAPLEMLRVPVALDGSKGMFRNTGPNHWGAHNDMEAIRLWLGTYLTAKKKRTFEAYRREVERFYVWCLCEAQVAISSVSVAHAMGYQLFLRAIPAAYISTARVTREDPRWRPWRGQIDQRNQAYALTVIKVMMEALLKGAYLTGNPMASLKSEATVERSMDTSRSLNQSDIDWVRDLLVRSAARYSQPDPDEADDEDDDIDAPSPALPGARTRRLKLILNVLLTTGMRLEELAHASIKHMQPAEVDGETSPNEFSLRVVGKGKKVRSVQISSTVYQLINEHHRDVETAIALREGEASPRLLAFRIERPMVAVLESAPASKDKTAKSTKATTGRALALSTQGLYKTLKGFFKTNALRELRRIKASRQMIAARQATAGQASLAEEFAKLASEIRALDTEAKVWQRRSKFTTHWLRHTFAKEVLRVNPNDAGLKMAQEMLGHASIATTGIYLKQDESAKVKAARLIFPKGI